MKRSTPIIVLFCALLTSTGCQSAKQIPAEPTKDSKTKLETFQARTGIVIVKGFSKIGEIRGIFGTSITVESKEFTDAGSGHKESGITISVKETQRLERENTSYIDYDEIDSLVRGIDYIGKVNGSVTKLENFQADYRTKGELDISTFNSDGEVLVAVASDSIGGARAYFKLSNLSEIRNLITGAKSRLDSIKQ